MAPSHFSYSWSKAVAKIPPIDLDSALDSKTVFVQRFATCSAILELQAQV